MLPSAPASSLPPDGGAAATALRDKIRSAGLAAGFAQVAFAPAEAPAHGEAYLAWIGAGMHGEMRYMAREDAVRRRLHPAEVMHGARTAIVTLLYYGPYSAEADREQGARDPMPVIARYAAGRDYHEVFEQRLDDLAARAGTLAPGACFKRYVDYGPVLERDLGQRAGLGWIGRNTMLISPKLGSYFMLGELFTNLDLPPDDAFEPDHCGSCRACVTACPTDAIKNGRVLDARLCISYLTIELRGRIPVGLRELIGTRVFGCDICQEVCPWNRTAEYPSAAPFGLPAGRAAPPPTMIRWAQELLHLSDAGFRDRYRGTAFARPGRQGLLRNLAVGLGNAGSGAAVTVLRRMVNEEPGLVAEHARWALDRLEGGGAQFADGSAQPHNQPVDLRMQEAGE